MTAAGQGEAAALYILERYIADLALVIENIAASVNPEVIILGGGVTQDQAIWWPMLTAKLSSVGLVDRVSVAELGNWAGCFGAAQLALERLREEGVGWSGGSEGEETTHEN
jgi:glucokinase